MIRLKLYDLLDWSGGQLLTPASSDAVFAGISSDTRTIEPDSLFLALHGQQHDGHRFLRQALDAGARGLIIDDRSALDSLPELPAGIAVILTADTLTALQQIAAGYRKTLRASVVGISGSVGKTSTRQMISACLQTSLRVHQTAGNLNNEIGLPQTILKAQPDDQTIILEMGMRGLGEISLLSRIAQPDIAILTCIGYSHIGRLGSQEAILSAKTEIIDGLRPAGLLLLNGDDPLLLAWGRQYKGRGRIAWITTDADLAAERVADGAAFAISAGQIETFADHSLFQVTLHLGTGEGDPIPVRLPMPGSHHIQNALFGLAVAHELDISLVAAAEAAKDSQNTGNRQRIIETGSLLIMDDSYNASPESMLAALRTLAELANGKRLIAALGCMLELGDFAESAHFNLGLQAAGYGYDRLLVTGPHSAAIINGAHQIDPTLPACEYEDNAHLAAALVPELRPGDCLLVKGSRGFAMEKVTEAILQNLPVHHDPETENKTC